ncbi:hypothetical protein [Aureispira anguillae]|uniref:Lipoprotein n=1 Tax=Aureispira anguillae TaxID=2864201 RepID=A0A915YD33_9BACT|nr:hypothetical protein [Aureispira anguillae]BDS10877.1 hypothetical protein AsAng_0015870 [Aureispira anguillae]
MKNLFLNSILLFLAISIFTSCEKKEIKVNNNKQESERLIQFSKKISLWDKRKNNNVILEISSHDESVLEKYNEKNLSIKPVFEIEEISNNQSDSNIENPPNIDKNKYEVHFKLISKSLEKNAIAFNLNFNFTENGRASGSYSGGYRYFYSDHFPHYFHVSPVQGCVSAWFYTRNDGSSTWNNWGNSRGYYLCTQNKTMYSTSAYIETMLKTTGGTYDVTWY